MDGTKRSDLKIGLYVEIETSNQNTTTGFIRRILSKKDDERGIRVELSTGETGRVFHIPTKQEIERLSFKFYNLLFHDRIYALHHRREKRWITIQRLFNGESHSILYLCQSPETVSYQINPEWYWKPISPKQSLQRLFNDYPITLVVINQDRQLAANIFYALEEQFKKMP